MDVRRFQRSPVTPSLCWHSSARILPAFPNPQLFILEFMNCMEAHSLENAPSPVVGVLLAAC